MLTKLLSWAGFTPVENLDAANATIEKRDHALATSRAAAIAQAGNSQTLSNALMAQTSKNTQLTRAIAFADARRKWCLPQLVEFPAGTPVKLHQRTADCLATFVSPSDSLFHVADPACVKCKPRWSLYWCLAHASAAAVRSAQALRDEDGISGDFLQALEHQSAGLGNVSTGESRRLQIAFNAIFQQIAPAMKEAQVGADILIIVAGRSLIPNGFARLFWIQAKRATGSAFTLDYSQANTAGAYQVDALRKVHRPKMGSIGLYVQYARDIPYVPAVLVNELPTTKYTADLNILGVRLPELLVAYTGNIQGVGAFADTDAILAYLDEVSEKKSLYVVTITDQGLEREHELLATVSDYYEKKLGLKKNIENNRDRGPEYDR